MTADPPPATPDDDVALPRSAATVILLRDADALEVLMLRRHKRSGFAASAWVFPGGVVDLGDAAVGEDNWTGIQPASLTDRFDLAAEQVLAMHVAAVRETFEEAGVLLAHHQDDAPVDVTDPAVVEFRHLLNDRQTKANWPAFLTAQKLVLDLGGVTCLSRWITPVAEPRRYDTYFFVAKLPDGAQPAADLVETTEARWITPADALDDDDFMMIFPTVRTMELLRDFATTDEVISHAGSVTDLAPTQPHVVLDDDGNLAKILAPGDEGYPDELYP